MDSNNKTLKQLLTEPYRVQKKDGYYSYEAFRSELIANFKATEKHEGGQILNVSAIKMLDSWNGMRKKIINLPDAVDSVKVLDGEILSTLFLLDECKQIAYLDKSICNLLVQTSLPRSYTLSRFFGKKLLILLPKGFLKVGSTPIHWLLFVFQQDRIAIVNSCMDCVINTLVPYCDGKGIEIGVTYEIWGAAKNPKAEKYSYIHFLINFLLWQQSMHDKGEEVITLNAPTRKMGFGKNSKQIIVPKVIGEGYKPKVIRNYEPTGTHASPRTHWRSGHWRQHMIGSRKEPSYKTIWIEPTLING